MNHHDEFEQCRDNEGSEIQNEERDTPKEDSVSNKIDITAVKSNTEYSDNDELGWTIQAINALNGAHIVLILVQFSFQSVLFRQNRYPKEVKRTGFKPKCSDDRTDVQAFSTDNMRPYDMNARLHQWVKGMLELTIQSSNKIVDEPIWPTVS